MKKPLLLVFALVTVTLLTNLGTVDAIDTSLCADDGITETPDFTEGRDSDNCLLIDPGNGDPAIPFQYEIFHEVSISKSADDGGSEDGCTDSLKCTTPWADVQAKEFGRCRTKKSGQPCSFFIWDTVIDNYLDRDAGNDDIWFIADEGRQWTYIKDSMFINGWKCSGGDWSGPNGIGCSSSSSSRAHSDGFQFRGVPSSGGWFIMQDSVLANGHLVLWLSQLQADPGPNGNYLLQGLQIGQYNTPLGEATNWVDDCKARGSSTETCEENRFQQGYAPDEFWAIDVWGPRTFNQLSTNIGKYVLVNTGCNKDGCDGTIGYYNGWPHPMDGNDPGPSVCPNGLITQNCAGKSNTGNCYCYTSIEEALNDEYTSTSNQGDCPDCPHKAPPFIQLSDTGWENPPSGAECGNGIVEGNEECDDNNTVSSDGCSSNCRIECTPGSNECDDGIFCNGEETCGADNFCHPGTTPCPEDFYSCTTITCSESGTCPIAYNDLDCDDSNTCTTDTCGVSGCQYSNVPDTTSCDDYNTCTLGDTCTAGICSGANEIIECTDDDGCCPLDCDPASDNDCNAVVFLIDTGSTTTNTDSQGRLWQADDHYSPSPGRTADVGSVEIQGTEDDFIYQTNRWGLDSYNLPVENGNYVVILHFAETWTGIDAPGERVFDIDVEGQILSDHDTFGETGGRNIALNKTFNVVVLDGSLDIEFFPYIQETQIDGIEVLGGSGSSSPQCNDGTCDPTETCSTCPEDCGTCSTCLTSSSTWQNNPITSQTGSFTVEYDATPNGAGLDAIVALSEGPGSDYPNFATLTRFYGPGIDSRDGGDYSNDTYIPYTPDMTYHFLLEVDVPSRTYNIYVTPENSSRQTVGEGYSFRDEQAGVASLDNWGLYSRIGSIEVCNFAVNAGDYHRADKNRNGCIDFSEIGEFINRWYVSSQDVGMVELVRALETWKGGC
jgi:cysteine-rich repeat protein